MTIIDKAHCDKYSSEAGDWNDCTVYACAIVSQIDYPTMRQYLEDECGRVKGKGLSPYKYQKALAALGFDLQELDGPHYNWVSHWVEGHWKYDWRRGREYWVNDHERHRKVKVEDGRDYGAATVGTLRKELPSGVYLVGTKNHVLAMVDGVVHDYRQGRNTDRRIVRNVVRVTESAPAHNGEVKSRTFRL